MNDQHARYYDGIEEDDEITACERCGTEDEVLYDTGNEILCGHCEGED